MATVLVIEPDRVLAETYGKGLRQAGHVPVVCATAQAAIEQADVQQPDVIVVELQLVAHSGIEFLYEFRSYSDWQSIPVIILSQVPAAQLQAQSAQLYEQLGVQAYLYKPTASIRQLVDAVESVAGRPA